VSLRDIFEIIFHIGDMGNTTILSYFHFFILSLRQPGNSEIFKKPATLFRLTALLSVKGDEAHAGGRSAGTAAAAGPGRAG
jgi:hypothetical protein